MQPDPSEKLAWRKEKVTLQAALHKAEDDLVKATARNENRPISDLSSNKVIPQVLSFNAQIPIPSPEEPQISCNRKSYSHPPPPF